MILTTKITWEKLNLELGLLKQEEPGSLLPILLGVNSLLQPQESIENVAQQIQYMAFEIRNLCEDLNEEDRLKTLNAFFFGKSQFQLLHECTREDQLLISTVFDQRRGHALALSHLYLHFAKLLDLPMTLLQGVPEYLIRWNRGQKSFYINLAQEGAMIPCERLSEWALPKTDKCYEVLNQKAAFENYLEALLKTYSKNQDLHASHTLLNIALVLDPHRAAWLEQRGLLLKELGYVHEAFLDFKRYVSFIEPSKIPSNVAMALQQLEELLKDSNKNTSPFLH